LKIYPYLRKFSQEWFCRMPNTKRITAGIILLHGERILLVLQRVTRKWGLPKGGKLENEDLLTCALRELYEETGVHLSRNDMYLGRKRIEYINCFVFEANAEYLPKSMYNNEEIIRARWFNISDLKKLNRNCSVKNWVKRTDIFSLLQVNIRVLDTGEVRLTISFV
jgi:8-oxo-dGTP pyrophosphatase MutT (NUDIX family)